MINQAERTWTKKIVTMLVNLHDPKKNPLIQNPRIKDLLARLNHQDNFKNGYHFGNHKIAEDLKRYADKNFQQKPDTPVVDGIRPSEVLRRAAQKNKEIIEKTKRRKEEEAAQRLESCDQEADERRSTWKNKLDTDSEVRPF